MLDRNIKEPLKMIETLKSDEDRKKAEMIYSLKDELNLREEINVTAKYYSFSFYPRDSSRALFKMDINPNSLRVKACLFFLEKHNEDADNLSLDLKEMIKSTPKCTRCSLNCKQGVSFKIDGEDYFSCINSGHYFKEFYVSECDMLCRLLKAEQ